MWHYLEKENLADRVHEHPHLWIRPLAGRMVYLWRAVDAEGEVLDVLVQSRLTHTFYFPFFSMTCAGFWQTFRPGLPVFVPDMASIAAVAIRS